jgi:hypothetical protein
MQNRGSLVAPIAALLALTLALPPGALAQEQQLEILTIRNRPAQDLVPLVRPLVGPGGSVTASGSKLIVSASPQALADVARVVRELDVPPRSLWISVTQERDSGESGQAAEVAGRVGSGGVSVQQPQTIETRNGTRVERRSGRSVVSGAFAGSSASETGSLTQSIAALEDRPAFISIGETRPVGTTVPVVGSDGSVGVAEGTLLPEASRGFYVIPRLSGDFVTLEVAVSGDRFATGGALELQRLETTASGRLGEWIPLGQLASEEALRASGLLWRATSLREDLRSVRIKVEAVR